MRTTRPAGPTVRHLLHSTSGSVRSFVLRYVRSEEDPLEILDPNLAASVAFDRWVRVRPSLQLTRSVPAIRGGAPT